MKTLELLQKAFNAFFIIIITLSILTWFGVINPFESFESAMSPQVEDKLRVDVITGDSDAQNKLGTLLYKQAQKHNSDFSEAISWLDEAAKQRHPIAQMNLAFAYKAGNGVSQSNDKAIEYFHKAGLNFLRMDYPMDAKDCVYSIQRLNTAHPLKRDLVNAIRQYEENADA